MIHWIFWFTTIINEKLNNTFLEELCNILLFHLKYHIYTIHYYYIYRGYLSGTVQCKIIAQVLV